METEKFYLSKLEWLSPILVRGLRLLASVEALGQDYSFSQTMILQALLLRGDLRMNDLARFLARFHGDDPLATARLTAVFIKWRPFTDSVRTGYKEHRVRVNNGDGHYVIAVLLAAPPRPVVSRRYSADEEALLKERSSAYTLQLFASFNAQAVEQFRARHAGLRVLVFRTTRDDLPWYVAVSGSYRGRDEAKAAIPALTELLQDTDVDIREAASQALRQIRNATKQGGNLERDPVPLGTLPFSYGRSL